MSNSKKCKYCNKEFSTIYKDSRRNYEEKEYCSIDCSNKSRVSYNGPEELKQLILDFIISKGQYCTTLEILKALKVSTKTLTKYQIKITELNEQAGHPRRSSLFETRVYEILKKYYSNIVCEYTNESLLSPKGFNLRIDFYIPELNLLVEADGTQHWDKTNYLYSEYLITCDSIKNVFAETSKIPLIRIPYTEHVTLDYIKKYISAIP